MYANPGTKRMCAITIPCRNQRTIQALTIPEHTLTQYNGNKRRKLEKIIIVTSTESKAKKYK